MPPSPTLRQSRSEHSEVHQLTAALSVYLDEEERHTCRAGKVIYISPPLRGSVRARSAWRTRTRIDSAEGWSSLTDSSGDRPDCPASSAPGKAAAPC